MTGSHSPSSPSIPIVINGNPLIHPSFHKSLAFELVLAFYYCILALVGMNTHNTRVILYCLLFIFNQCIKIVVSLLNSVDPLGVGQLKMMVDVLGWVCKANMVYLLCVLLYLEHPLPVFLMIVHFVVANYRRNRTDISQPHQKGRSFYKIMDFINPILLYSFLKEFDSEQSDLSIIFLIFLCANLICVSEMRLILAHQQCDIAGWFETYRGTGSVEFVWDRAYALKLIVIGSCVVLLSENILISFESIKNQVCLNILHTLIIAISAFVVSSPKKLPST